MSVTGEDRLPGDPTPREFLARARAEDAALLEPRWSEFERPISETLRGAY